MNDGYVPPQVGVGPPRPSPSTWDEAVWARTQNPVYYQPMANPIRCALPPINEYSRTADDYLWNLQAHLDCVMGAWHAPLANAGFTLTKPELYIYANSANSPCGTVDGAAGFYCSANQGMIYIDLTTGFAQPYANDDGWITYNMESLLGHEFGHHVQSRTGILRANYLVRSQLPPDQALEEQRRLELQVQCFSGLYLSAAAISYGLTESDRRALIRFETGGDSQTHGLGRLRGAWFASGLASGSVSTCNTFVVGSADVA